VLITSKNCVSRMNAMPLNTVSDSNSALPYLPSLVTVSAHGGVGGDGHCVQTAAMLCCLSDGATH
jgi:hypothetical protein